MLDQNRQPNFNIQDVYDAAEAGRLVELLEQIDDSGAIEFWSSNPRTRGEVEKAMGAAALSFEGRELGKAGVGDKALCLSIPIVLEALQQNFSK